MTTLRIGAEELMESVLSAHYAWLVKSNTFYNDRTVNIDISNQPDACDESPFIIGRYKWPNGVEVSVIATHIGTVDNVASFVMWIGE